MKKIIQAYYRFHYRKNEFYQKLSFLYSIFSLLVIVFWVFAFKSAVLDANNIPSGSMQPTLKIGDFLFVNKMRYTITIPFTEISLFRIDRPGRGDIVTFTPPQRDNFSGKTLVKRVIGVPGDTVEIKDNEIYINGKKYRTSRLTDLSPIADLDHDNIEFLRLFREDIHDPRNGQIIVSHYMLQEREIESSSPYMPRFRMVNYMKNPERKWIIPAGKYMVMGDNRDNSDDSRGCNLVYDEEEYKKCFDFYHFRESSGDIQPSTQWGLVDIENIHGKVFMSYFSVNWGTRGMVESNPIKNIFQWVTGQYSNAFIRWNRIFQRIY